MKHTPGPWKVAPVEGKRMTCVYTDKTNIALLVHQEDAHLIAAAPELLEALKEYIEVMGPAHENECPQDDTCNCKWKYINDKVNQAIAKAEGAEK